MNIIKELNVVGYLFHWKMVSEALTNDNLVDTVTQFLMASKYRMKRLKWWA
jgi:hypothetical protein